MLEQHGHGGDLQTASALYGMAPDQFLDFSANMNPLGPPEFIAALLAEHWKDIAHYPDPVSRRLRHKLADHYDIPADSILIGNGAAELIELVVRWKQPRRTILARPCFAEYEQAIHKIGGQIQELTMSPETDFTVDRSETMQALEAADAIFLGNPNNPTGMLLPSNLTDELKQIARPNKSVIIDEAFLDFVEQEQDHTLIREAAHTEGLYVIRSMTKFYAIPGLRLGFIVAHPEAVQELRQLQTPWSVNYFAQLIGEQVLDDAAFAERTIRWLNEERPWFQEQLKRLGLRIFPGKVNFVLFQLPPESGMTVRDLQHKLGKQGILIRDASHFPGLDETYGRLAVKLRSENVKLIKTLSETLSEGRGME